MGDRGNATIVHVTLRWGIQVAPIAERPRETVVRRAGVTTQQPLVLAKALIEARKDSDLYDNRTFGSNKGAATKTIADYVPPGVQEALDIVVEKTGIMVRPVRSTAWKESHLGDSEVRPQLRTAFNDSGLPPHGEILDRAHASIREHP